VAAVVGGRFGVHRWSSTSGRTLEGSLALALVVFLLLHGAGAELKRSAVAGMAAALVEASTRHMDNLVLPLLVFLL